MPPLTRPVTLGPPLNGSQKIRTIELDGKTVKLQIVSRILDTPCFYAAER